MKIKIETKLIIAFAVILQSISLHAQDSDRISLNYSLHDFSLLGRNDSIKILSNELECHYLNDSTLPALPYIEYNFIVDNNINYVGHNYTLRDTLIDTGVVLLPNSLSIPSSFVQKQTKYDNQGIFEYNNVIYPSEKVVYLGSHLFRNTKILSFSISPFSYDAEKKHLFLSTNIELDIEIEDNGKVRKLRSDMTRCLSDDWISNEQTKFTNNKVRTAKLDRNTNIEYLVITCDSFKNEFQKLADWKTLKGIPAKVVTTEQIYANVEGKNHQQKIKNAIKQYFTQTDSLLQYVLLGGDIETVPTQKCYVSSSSYKANVASDVYYSSLKQIEWDTNGNGKVGEVRDNIDIAFDLIVTRLSVKNIQDCRAQISRILKYEQTPDTIGWNDNILMGGATILDRHYNYPEGRMSDTQYKSENNLYKKYIKDNWLGANKYMFYDTGTSFTGNDLYQFRTCNMLEQLGKGYTFFNVITHGNPDGWKMEWCPDSIEKLQFFTVNDIKHYTNSGNTMIVTTACHTNAFDSLSTCLSEAFMRHGGGGVIAYYGSTHYGWESIDSISDGPSSMFSGLFYRTLLQSAKHEIGQSIYESKALKIGLSNQNNTYRWLILSLNALCDPEMSLYIRKPKRFNHVEINLNDKTATIETGEPDCKICISANLDNEDNFYEIFNTTDNAIFNINRDSEYTICITKAGFVPYIATVSGCIIIQNTNIESDISLYADSVKIGNNISSNHTPGDVNIRNCKVTIKSNGNTLISNGVKVYKDSQLRIN